MPRPVDLHTLFDVTDGSFPFPDWQAGFGGYRWFHVAGFRDVAEACGIKTATELKQNRLRAVMSLPQGWRDIMPDGEWDRLSGPQIDLAYHREPMRFDKGALSILTLEATLKEMNENSQAHVDYLYRHVRLRPALYRVEGFTRDHLNGYVDGLKAAAGQQFDHVFIDMTSEQNSRPVTHQTARAVAECLNKNHGGAFRVSPITRRDELPARCKSPSAREFVGVAVSDPPPRAAGSKGQAAA
jgi:hypothetical protein